MIHNQFTDFSHHRLRSGLESLAMHHTPRRLMSLRSATLLLGAAALLSACSLPVRFATQAEIKAANAPTPPPKTIVIAPQAPVESPSPGDSPTPVPSASAATGSGGLAGQQAAFRQIVDNVSPSIVEIDTNAGLGSGIIVDTAGDVVTNAHVVEGATSYKVLTSDGRTFTGSLVGTYTGGDLAVVKMAGASGLKPATFADSSKVHVGDIVLAIGSPLGLTGSVSEGIISGTGRSQQEPNGTQLNDLIQTTAPINPGNSGGALVDINSQVVGIPTLASASGRGGAATNIGFAIPSNQVVNAEKQLISGGTVTHTNQAYMGVSVQTNSGGGALVGSVVAGGPAARAGIQAGYIINKVAGHAIGDSATLTDVLAGYKPGDRVDVSVQLPDGTDKTISVTLGERPATP